jgi:hypothetical protein
MRAFVSSLLVVAACGGAAKPADAPAVDTSSSEPSGSASTPADMPPGPDSTSNPASHAQDRAASATGSPGAAPSSISAGAGAPDAPAKQASFHPVPTSTGSIDGQQFLPKLAQVSGRMQKDGRILLSLSERTDCPTSGDVKPGDAILTMVVPWKNGYKADLGSLRRSGKKAGGEIAFSRVNALKKSQVSTTFKPSGTVTIVSAPMEQNAVGKMKIDLASGDYMLAGDLDIQVCVSPR